MIHLIEDHPTHFKLSNGVVFPKNAQTLCKGGVYDFVSKQAQMLAGGGTVQGVAPGPYTDMFQGLGGSPVVSESTPAQNIAASGQYSGLAEPYISASSAPLGQGQVPSAGAANTSDPGLVDFMDGVPRPFNDTQQPSAQVPLSPTDSSDPASVSRPNTALSSGFFNPGTMSTTKTERVINDPAQLKIQQDAAKEAEGHVNALGELGAAQSALDAEQAKNKQSVHTDEQAIIEQHAISQKALNDNYQIATKKLIDQYAQAKIVPKTIFEADNLGQNIAAGISIGLGALGGALTHSNQNIALDIFNKAIDRDMEAQKYNLEKIPTQINMLGVAYKAAREAGLDDQQAQLMAKGKALESIADQYDAVSKSAQSEVVRQKAALEAAKIRAEAAKNQMNATARKVETTTMPMPVLQKFTDADQKTAQDIQNKDDAIHHIRDLAELATKKGDLGPISGRLQSLKGMLGVQSSNPAELQRALQTYMTDESFTSRYSPDVAEVLKKEGPTMTERPEQFFAKLNGIDQLNVNQDARLWAAKPMQRDVQRVRLKSQLKPEMSSSDGSQSPFIPTGKRK